MQKLFLLAWSEVLVVTDRHCFSNEDIINLGNFTYVISDI